jgi:thiosulfate/3-mercaptopyruvate sulfurtransferase
MTRCLHTILVLIACWLPGHAALAAQGIEGRLVDTAWLAQRLHKPELVLLDASPAPLFARQHIAGAVNVDLFSYGASEASPAVIEKRFQSWGVSPGKTVVIYDQGGTYWATRTFFDLLYRGFPASDLHIVDGGLAKWMAGGGAVTKDPTPAPAPGTFRVTRALEELRVRLPEFLVASGDPKSHALVEALEPSSHYGQTTFFDRRGHVPYATMLPTEELFNADKTFKSPAEIRRMLDHLGIKPEQQVHSYCGGGLAASVPFFALKYLAGYSKVKLYQESQLEWMRDERGLPLWTYSAPYLMREASWLKGWSSAMVRMFDVSKVSVVDVRAPEAYQLGHLPFALNVPADRIDRHLREPAQLAELLGRAGIDPSHEAVVVSEGGLDERAALAFLALHASGQQRVSILMPSTERWAELGHEVTRTPTAVGPKKSPMDPSIVPVAYASAARANVMVFDPETTRGLYPKVYVASGNTLPARKVEGRVVHLPYTSLLDANSQPKPAGDLWKAIAQAGVPRYAEIVVFSDALGEAAANYFLLKLMGFADVKVWAPK